MYIIGLTGSIGMGKSAVAAMARRLRIPVFEADKTIHKLYNEPTVAKLLALTFPETVLKGAVNRQKLSEIVFDEPERRLQLTSILYPALAVKEKQFLRTMAARRVPLVILDIPLLFETSGQGRVDATMVVNTYGFLQRQRALARPGMTPERLAAILATQIDNKAKCRAADYVINTGCARAVTFQNLKRDLRRLQQKLVASRRPVWDTFIYARNRS